jgi:hypothetical protein
MLSAMAACFGQRTNRPGRYTEGDLLLIGLILTNMGAERNAIIYYMVRFYSEVLYFLSCLR